jgi:hypothetical protein
MISRAINVTVTYIFILLLASIAFGQQTQGQTQTKSESQYVDFSGFKGKVFEVKHRDPEDLRHILGPLGSGFKGATITASRTFKTLTVRDFPENIAAMEEALKRLDVPLPAQAERPAADPDPNVELHLHVLVASNIEGASNQQPAELKDTLKQLQSTLTYKNYYLLTSIVQRTRIGVSGNTGIQGEGLATAGAPLFPSGQAREISAHYSYSINQIYPELKTAGSPIAVRNFNFAIQGAGAQDNALLGSAKINTNLSVRDGEQVVVGTASLKDKGLILVLSAKVIK